MPDDIENPFDGLTQTEDETILVRISEWTTWIPCITDDDMPALHLSQGFTSFKTGKHERLLELGAMNTNKSKQIVLDDGKTYKFMLYAFQAVLAHNDVDTDAAAQLMEAQKPPEHLSERNKASDLVVVKNNSKLN